MEKLFRLKENNTTVRIEALAGLTTFLAMCYIIFVNPAILEAAGLDARAVMIATCLSAAVGTLLSGILSNYPLAQAPGMGLNAFFAYTVCGTMGYSWRAGLAAVFISGVFFIVLTITKLRTILVAAIPMPLKRAISAGIGLFIALIGLAGAGIVATPKGGSTIIGLGDFTSPAALLAVFGLVLTIALLCLKIKGSLFFGIAITSAVGAVLQFGFGIEVGVTSPEMAVGLSESFRAFGGVIGQCFTGFGELFRSGEGFGVMLSSAASILITMTLTDMFDTIGALVATAEKAGFLDENGDLPRGGRALLADAIATAAGAVLGTSTVTTYIESNAGISAGGRTGLTSVVTGVLFLLSPLLAPILGLVPEAATAPILIVVGIMMVASLKDIRWDDLEEAIPCFVVVVMTPLSYSVADGIGLGFIFYALVKLFTGKIRSVHPILLVFALIFAARYVFL